MRDDDCRAFVRYLQARVQPCSRRSMQFERVFRPEDMSAEKDKPKVVHSDDGVHHRCMLTLDAVYSEVGPEDAAKHPYSGVVDLEDLLVLLKKIDIVCYGCCRPTNPDRFIIRGPIELMVSRDN